MTATSMLAAARKSLGLAGRPNYITRDYASRHGGAFLTAPWCNMSITYWARVSGNGAAVLPDGDRAYTVWHAEDGRDLGRWFPGTVAAIKAHAEPGAIMFFDWDGSNTISRIDHVGIVERVLPDGRVQTIEGNTADACKRRIRSASVIAGFWNPPYKSATPRRNWTEELVDTLPTLNPGDEHRHVKTMRALLHARGYEPRNLHSTVYGYDEDDLADLRELVDEFKQAHGLARDGIFGTKSWKAALT